MKEIKITTPIMALSYDELDETERLLVDHAREATKRAYAPYSHYNVGAAILLDNGEIVTGSNQENAAFPSGTCAERTACYWAGAHYPGVPFRKIAVASVTPEGVFQEGPCSPCGACRQALLEYENLAGRPVEVLLVGAEVVYRLPSVISLLPLGFTSF